MNFLSQQKSKGRPDSGKPNRKRSRFGKQSEQNLDTIQSLIKKIDETCSTSIFDMKKPAKKHQTRNVQRDLTPVLSAGRAETTQTDTNVPLMNF